MFHLLYLIAIIQKMYEGSVDNVVITDAYIFHCQPPINLTPRPYLGVLRICTLLYPGSRGRRNSCRGHT